MIDHYCNEYSRYTLCGINVLKERMADQGRLFYGQEQSKFLASPDRCRECQAMIERDEG